MTRLFPIRVLLADDHPMIREAIKSMIEREPQMILVGEAKNGMEAIHLFEETEPHITLMDINMPIMDGLEAIRQIREINDDARIIILTNFDTDDDLKKGMDAGAMGYLLKDTSQEGLLETIRTVHAGEKFVPQNLMNKVSSRNKMPKLSPREITVLERMKKGKSNRAIGVELGITESTVKSHVKNILIKLSVNDRTQAVTQAIQRGIIRLDE
jgi:two-component system NarL family response regulator